MRLKPENRVAPLSVVAKGCGVCGAESRPAATQELVGEQGLHPNPGFWG